MCCNQKDILYTYLILIFKRIFRSETQGICFGGLFSCIIYIYIQYAHMKHNHSRSFRSRKMGACIEN